MQLCANILTLLVYSEASAESYRRVYGQSLRKQMAKELGQGTGAWVPGGRNPLWKKEKNVRHAKKKRVSTWLSSTTALFRVSRVSCSM